MPASYAGIAAAAAHTNQPAAPLKQKVTLPLIMEIMVICLGGHIDPHTEQSICACAADTIICEVHLKMAKAVANLIPLKASRWSINPHSKGNFVYSFDGSIPFDSITSYEHILLSPFMGTGQLCPSLGWTCLLVHSMPTMDDDNIIFGPDLLLTETKAVEWV
jgi:hypothetical protein